MVHKRIIASLPEQQRKHLIEKRNGPALFRFALQGGAILCVGTLIAADVPLWPVLMLLQGILIIFLFTLLHECIHRTAFRSNWMNDAAAALCGFLILLPPAWFRYFHFAHHRHTQDPDNDPELALAKPETRSDYLVHITGVPAWKSQIATLTCNARGLCRDDFVPASARGDIRREARVMLLAYAAVALACFASGSLLPLYVWVIPAVLGQPFLRLYLLAEHGRCAFVSNMFENSRTTFTNSLVRWLAWNMPYHAEHHAYPGVPFHRLPELHTLVRSDLKVTENGYTRFHRSYLSSFRASSG